MLSPEAPGGAGVLLRRRLVAAGIPQLAAESPPTSGLSALDGALSSAWSSLRPSYQGPCEGPEFDTSARSCPRVGGVGVQASGGASPPRALGPRLRYLPAVQCGRGELSQH